MRDIYSDIRGQHIKIVTANVEEHQIRLFDKSNSSYTPNLILPNQLAVRELMQYLDDCLYKITKKRFKNTH